MDNGTAQSKNNPVSSPVPAVPVISSGGLGGVEREGLPAASKEQSSSASVETAPLQEKEPTESKTMPEHGVVVELPPDVKTLGGGTPAPVAAAAASPVPPVQLPVSDDAVVRGLHADVANPLLWLAFWCVRKLKKAHVLLKVVQGKVVRVPEKITQ